MFGVVVKSSHHLFCSSLRFSFFGKFLHLDPRLDMAAKFIPTHLPIRIHPNLIEFGYEFGFSLISKHGYEIGNIDIGTHPELMSNLLYYPLRFIM